MTPGRIGCLTLEEQTKLRAATSETMATDDGDATDVLIALYSTLARGGVGLIISGHIYGATRPI